MAEGGGSLTCAICFEDFDEATPLPCSCKIDYCVKCWDKALASSFRNTHQPRCPTCRAPIRVDFDAERRRLVFSLEQGPVLDISDLSELQSRAAQGSLEAAQEFEQLSQGLSESLEEIVERLAQQAIPAQTRLLEHFGASHPELGELALAEEGGSGVLAGLSIAELKRHVATLGGTTEGCLERADVLSRLREVAGGSWAAVASYWASAGGSDSAPVCVCGDSLSRVSGRERASLWFEHVGFERGTPRFEQELRAAQLSDTSGVICDMCDVQVPWSSSVWTCQGGDSTILHALSYDICDRCFRQHTFGVGTDSAEGASPATDADRQGDRYHAIL